MITLNVFVRVKPEHREELLAVGHTLFNQLPKEPTFIDAFRLKCATALRNAWVHAKR